MKTIDLHGYPTWQAIELATASIKEAFENGDERIEIIHGSPDVRHHMHVQIQRRGSIKWAIRGLLNRGELNDWVFPRRSRKHQIYDGSMILKIR